MNQVVEKLILDVDIERLFKVYHYMFRMMKDRGYKPLFLPFNKNRFISHVVQLMANNDSPHKFMDKLKLKFEKEEKEEEDDDDENVRCLVYFHCIDIKFKKMDMEYLLKLMEEVNCQKLLLITNTKINSMILNSIYPLKDDIQIFVEKELLHCIMDHAFMPTFSKLTEQEKNKMLEFYNCQENDFPQILEDDPVVKYYNYKIGDMLRIQRYNGTEHPDLYYRVVVKKIQLK